MSEGFETCEPAPPAPRIAGILAVSYATADVDLGVRFFSEWGLEVSSQTPDLAVLRTTLGSEVHVASLAGEPLPGARREAGFKGTTWGVDDECDLDTIAARLSAAGIEHRREDDRLRAVDPFGYEAAFCVASLRHSHEGPVCRYNAPGARQRVSQETPVRTQARPARIGHVVFEVAGPQSLARAERFYRDLLDFRVSDRYAAQSAFLRCAEEQDHHNIAFLGTPRRQDVFQHVAFETNDIHEVFSGGLQFSERGWDTAVGPGRHKFSSAYFWYFNNPLGGEVEYFADMDYLDARWEPRDQPPSPASIAEWSLPAGVRRFTSMSDLKSRAEQA